MRDWLRATRAAAWAEPLGVRLWHPAAAVGLALLVALLDGASIGLLVPIAQGVVRADFSGVSELPVIGAVAAWTLRHTTGTDVGAGFAGPFLVLATLAFLAAVGRSAAAYGSHLFGAYWLGVYEKRAHVFALERYLRFGKRYFDEINRGEVHAVLGYVGELIDSIKLAQLALVDLLTLGAYLAVMLWISPALTGLLVVAVPLVHRLIRGVVRRIQRASEQMNAATLEHHGRTQNILSSVALLKSFGAEARVRDRFEAGREHLRRINFRINAIQGLITPAQELVALVVLLALIGVVVVGIGDRAPERLAAFLVFLYVVRMALPRLTGLQERLTTLAVRRPRLAQLAELLDDAGKHIVPDGARPFPGLERSIEVRDLSFSYVPGVPVLRGIDLRIERGRKTALVGPSGAGKSTLVQLLLRLYDVPPGTILVDGRDLRSFRIGSYRSHIAVVPQEVLLFNDTLRANLQVGAPAATDDELVEALERARLGDLLSSLPEGLDTRIGDEGIRLSGGQRQRVAICRALLREPEILILDEATSALDAGTERLVQESIAELLRERTSIVIAHRPSTVANADHVVVLVDGRVAEAGPPDRMMSAGGYLAEA